MSVRTFNNYKLCVKLLLLSLFALKSPFVLVRLKVLMKLLPMLFSFITSPTLSTLSRLLTTIKFVAPCLLGLSPLSFLLGLLKSRFLVICLLPLFAVKCARVLNLDIMKVYVIHRLLGTLFTAEYRHNANDSLRGLILFDTLSGNFNSYNIDLPHDYFLHEIGMACVNWVNPDRRKELVRHSIEYMNFLKSLENGSLFESNR